MCSKVKICQILDNACNGFRRPLGTHSSRSIYLRGTGQLQPHPPIFSKKVEIFIPLEVYTYIVTACLILLATST